MRLHRHVIRASAMLDKVEQMVGDMVVIDGPSKDDVIEHIQTIRSDIRHADRKLAAFQQITEDILHAE